VFNIEQVTLLILHKLGHAAHRNGVLSGRENAGRMRQARAEIGQRLRKRYDAGKWPMSDRLADLVRKIQHPNGLCEER
jgi:hypothetical protein